MKILIGTTNESKVNRFKELLSGHNCEFFTLKDLNITDEPEEKGQDPKENAIIKAKFYGSFFDKVICNDSGLYFEELPFDDPRQPGLNVRTPCGKRLDDNEMIEYYSGLIRSLGGKVSAYYLDGFAVFNNGEIFSYMDEVHAKTMSFFMTDKSNNDWTPGWPLDSMSISKKTGKLFTDKENKYYEDNENIIVDQYRKSFQEFLIKSFGF